MRNNIGSFSLIKKINTALILNLIRTKGQVSRIEIARESGLTAATVTNITSELIDRGIVEEAATGTSTGGRRPVILKLCSQSLYVGSAYISPHGVDVVVSDFNAKIVFRKSMLFSSSGAAPELCIDYICRVLCEFEKENSGRTVGIALGLHGVADSETGVLISAPNLGWQNVAIGEMLQKKCGIDVYVQNDVRLMANAEMNFGVARNIENFVFFYVGSGVGAAVVSGGELLRGSNNAAGELGHTIIDPDGPLCQCGSRGCLQALTGEEAMLRRMRDWLCDTSTLNQSSTCADIMMAYIQNNDKTAKQVIDEELKYLSIGISNIINIFNPDLIVVGSGIEGFGEALVSELAKRNIQGAAKGISCETVFSALGGDAVLLGGIAMVIKKVCDNPYELLLV